MQNMLPEQPLSAADLASAGIRQFRLLWKPLLLRFAAPCVFSSAAITGLEWTITRWLESGEQSLATLPSSLGLCLFFAGILVLAQWSIAIRGSAFLRQLIGLAENYDEGLAYGRRRKWSILLIYSMGLWQPLLLALLTGFVTALALIAGKTYELPLAPLFLAYSLLLCLVLLFGTISSLYILLLYILICCENLSVGSVWRRGWEMVKSGLWRGCYFVTILYTCIFMIGMAVQTPLIVLQLYETTINASGGMTHTPLYLRVMETFWGTVTTYFSIGAGFLGGTLYYLDLRMRLEGRDLTSMLVSLEAKS